jgi:hypothetical protein
MVISVYGSMAVYVCYVIIVTQVTASRRKLWAMVISIFVLFSNRAI